MSRPPTWAVIVAVLVPLALGVAGVVGIERYKHPEEREELANAGNVLNGTVLRESVVSVISKRMRHEPKVVILGNSLANTNVLPGMLAAELEINGPQVQRFSVPNSIGAHWYAILKHRVYGEGHKPELVIVLADLRSTLATRPVSQASYLNLQVHLDEDDEEIRERLGEGNEWLAHLAQNRQRLRERALTGMRNAVVDVGFFHRPPKGEEAHERTVLALGRVFDNAAVDTRLHHDVMPTFASNLADDAMSSMALPPPEQSFLPLISELVAANGGKLVIVRPPFAPSVPPHLADAVPEQDKEKAREILEADGNHLLDLRGARMIDGHYYNADHMVEEGAKRFTSFIVQGLRRDGLMSMALTPGVALLDPLELVADDARWAPPRAKSEGAAAPDAAQGMPERAQGRLAAFRAPRLVSISDMATAGRTPYFSRCSPLRVAEDGQDLPIHNVTCDEAFRQHMGRVCHAKERVMFAGSDGTIPTENGHSYTLHLAETRSCDGNVWLYPGDMLTISLGERTVVGEGPWDRVWVDGMVAGPTERGDGVLGVTLFKGQDELGEGQVALARVHANTAELQLPATREVPTQLVLQNESDQYVLITGLQLTSWFTERPLPRWERGAVIETPEAAEP